MLNLRSIVETLYLNLRSEPVSLATLFHQSALATASEDFLQDYQCITTPASHVDIAHVLRKKGGCIEEEHFWQGRVWGRQGGESCQREEEEKLTGGEKSHD